MMMMTVAMKTGNDEDGAIAGAGKTSSSECCVGLGLRILSASAVGRGLLLHLLFASFAQAVDTQARFCRFTCAFLQR